MIARWFSPCLVIGHSEEQIKVLRGDKLHLECSRCQADLGEVLPGQKFTARKVKAKRKTRKSADVLHPVEFVRESQR